MASSSVDFRSDTVTRPSAAMRSAMANAEVGDDVFGDDPTVKQLEATVAELLGKQAAVYVTSGTQSNLCALMAHCQRGDEYIVGERAHTFWYEAGGAAVLGSIQPQPVRMLANGMLDLEHVHAVVKDDDSHFARSRLLCLENTQNGHVLSLQEHDEAAAVAHQHGLAMHLDGARLWNAAVALDVAPSVLAEPFDTVSVCLSKGLGAPVGSVLVGSHELIAEARKWRKMLGGSMRQAGLVAAAGLYALEHNRHRLAEDHKHAQRLADGLSALDGVDVVDHATNMVFVDFDADPAVLQQALDDAGIQVIMHPAPPRQRARLVTHLGVTSADVDRLVGVLAAAL